jgi:hypothetical protein
VKLDEKTEARLIKRVRQIATEIDSEFIGEYKEMPLDTLAFRLKVVAGDYNCYIHSWISDSGDAVAEVYNASDYIEEDENTWELCTSQYEPAAICIAFKWLADRQYLRRQE